MQIKMQDGVVFIGRNSTDIVRQMRRDEWNAPDKKLAYMEEVSLRVQQQTGKVIAFDSPPKFVAGLVEAGVATRLQ